MGKPQKKTKKPAFKKKMRRKQSEQQQIHSQKRSHEDELVNDKNKPQTQNKQMESQKNSAQEQFRLKQNYSINSLIKKTQHHMVEQKKENKTDKEPVFDFNNQFNKMQIKISESSNLLLRNENLLQIKSGKTEMIQETNSKIHSLLVQIQSENIDQKSVQLALFQLLLVIRQGKKHDSKIIGEKNFVLILNEVFGRMPTLSIKLSILEIISSIIQKFDNKKISWIENEGISFLLDILAESQQIFKPSAQILQNLVGKNLKYRNQIVSKNDIFQLLESPFDPVTIDTKVSLLSCLFNRSPYILWVHANPIVEHFFKLIKLKSLNKISLAKVIQAIKIFLRKIDYQHLMKVDEEKAQILCQIIEESIVVKVSPYVKDEMKDDNEDQNQKSEQSQRQKVLEQCISAFSALTVEGKVSLDYRNRVQLLQKCKIVHIVQKLIGHNNFNVRSRTVQMLHGLLSFFVDKELQQVLINRSLMKRLVGLLESQTIAMKLQICEIYKKIAQDDNQQTFILDFFIQHQIPQVLLSSTKGCKSNQLVIKVLKTLQQMLSHAQRVTNPSGRRKYYSSIYTDPNPLVDKIKKIPGIQVMFDRFMEFQGTEIAELAEALDIKFLGFDKEDSEEDESYGDEHSEEDEEEMADA